MNMEMSGLVFAHQAKAVDCEWAAQGRRDMGLKRLCNPVGIGPQPSGQGQVKAKLLQHIGVAPLCKHCLLPLAEARLSAACKLRFVQKKVNLHLVDIWNVIEAFRENGLNAVDWGAEVKVSTSASVRVLKHLAFS